MKNEFSELRQALICWYPFRKNWKVLIVESADSVMKEYLNQRVLCVDDGNVGEIDSASGRRYDCIFLAGTLEIYSGNKTELLRKMYALLNESGVLLIGFRNRFGMKYLCGKTDDLCPVPFANYEENTRLLSKQMVDKMAAAAGFTNAFHYYPLPDPLFVQAVYSDDRVPSESIHDRVFPIDPFEGSALFPESEMLRTVIEEKKLQDHANYILAEYRKKPRPGNDVYPTAALLSADRGEEHSFATVFLSDCTVLKQPIHPAGRASLETMYRSLEELHERGLQVVEQELTDEGVRMPEVQEETLLSLTGRLIREENRTELFRLFDLLYKNVLKSSDKADSDAVLDNDWADGRGQLGPVLHKAYIDMIPYNGFWTGNDIRYYDQEFVRYNCPAKYVVFRAIYYTYIHFPQLEQVIPQYEMKEHFGLQDNWNLFVQAENRFVADNRNWKKYGKIYDWAHEDKDAIARRRSVLADSRRVKMYHGDREYNVGLLMGVFDMFHIGHLRLIRRAKEHCNYLRVAVLSDELVMKFKHHAPVIPLAERMEVLAAVREVDEVVAVRDDPSRLLEYSRRPFDCFFSGDDYAGNEYWEWEKAELRKLGSDIMFFSYTPQQSSTHIRTSLAERQDLLKPSDTSGRIRAVVWGIGKIYNEMYKTFRYLEAKGELEIIALTQTEPSPYARVDGIPVIPKEQLGSVPFDCVIVCNQKHFREISKEIVHLTGVQRDKIISFESVLLADDSLLDYLQIVKSRPTIVTSTSWGDFVYRCLNMQCLSPFCNLRIADDDFFRLVQNLKYYVTECSPVFARWDMDNETGIKYPVLRLGDIELHFIHSDNAEKCIEEWERRKKRMNWDNIIVEYYSDNAQKLSRFAELDIPWRKIIFTASNSGDVYASVCKEYRDPTGLDACYREVCPDHTGLRFKLLRLLAGKEDIIRSLTIEEYALLFQNNDSH